MMIDLTDKEVDRIYETVEYVRIKHMDGSDITGEKLHRLHNELEGRLNDLGYVVTVDVTPLFEGLPPTVRIDERIDRKEFDPERKQYEVRKRVERNEDDPGDKIEGVI